MDFALDFSRHVMFAVLTMPFIWLAKNGGSLLHRFFDDTRSRITHNHVMQNHQANLVACTESDCATFPDQGHLAS